MSTPAIPAPVDPTTIPALSGVFAPTTDEHDVADLVVHGELPDGLSGAYLRNGPNPLYPPLGSYTYPLDGDGMIHGLWFEEGRVRYRNRVIWTPQLRAERAAGRALWAGLRTPYLPDATTVPAELANTYKPLPDINVVRHGGRYLALGEVDAPTEITVDLATIGSYDFGGAVPGMCAHPKIDRATGEMVLFRYNIEAPFLTWSTVAPDGSVPTPPRTVDVGGAFMIHDFAITASSVLLFIGPLEFDFDAMFSGGDMLAWKPDLGMRVAVIDRTGGAIRWIHTDAFWVWHFANAFDRTNDAGRAEIIVDYSEWSRPGIAGTGPVTGAVSRAVLDPDAGTMRVDHFSDETAEFARIDDRLIGQPHRFFVVTNRSGDDVAVDEQNALLRVDGQTGAIERWHSGDAVFDEVCFVPAPNGGPEDGYYVTFRTDRTTLTSDFVVLAADDIAAGPVATIALPFRVPAGLHGNWFAG